MARLVRGFFVFAVDEEDRRLLAEALECHVEGLKTARVEVEQDRTLETPEQLATAARSVDDDIERGKRILLEVFHVSVH